MLGWYYHRTCRFHIIATLPTTKLNDTITMTICTNHETLCRGKLLHYYVGIYIDGLMQDCYRPIVYVLEILRFCTKPSIYTSVTCFCRHKVPADLIHIYWDYFIGTGAIIESRAGDSVLTNTPDSKIHGTNLGPIWGRQDPGGPHIGAMNLAIWDGQLNKMGVSKNC